MKNLKFLLIASILTTSSFAIEPMKNEAGWSGFVVLGGGNMSYKNNEISGSSQMNLSNETINNRGKANSESSFIPMITGALQYTFDDKKTEIFLGNALEDYLRLDTSTALGIRHEYDNVGIIGVRGLFSTFPTNVWEDPLATGVKREKTDRTSGGIGVKWERIMDSNFEVDFRFRNIDFDNDSNGLSLVNNAAAGTSAGSNGEVYITSDEQKLLSRKGTEASLEFLYTWNLDNKNFIIPSFTYSKHNRDGAARDNDEIELKLTHAYWGSKWVVSSNVFIGTALFDQDNPVYNKKQDANSVGAGVNITYKEPFGWKKFGINANIATAKSDSDIDFYDSELFVATLGLAYRF